MTVRDQIFAARLAQGVQAAAQRATPGTRGPGPNPLRHLDHPAAGSALRPVASRSSVVAPLNQPAAPMPSTRATGAVSPASWPPRRRPGIWAPALPYRGPYTSWVGRR